MKIEIYKRGIAVYACIGADIFYLSITGKQADELPDSFFREAMTIGVLVPSTATRTVAGIKFHRSRSFSNRHALFYGKSKDEMGNVLLTIRVREVEI